MSTRTAHPDRCRMLRQARTLERLARIRASIQAALDGGEMCPHVFEHNLIQLNRVEDIAYKVSHRSTRCKVCLRCGQCEYHARCAKLHGYHAHPEGGWQPCPHDGLRMGVEVETLARHEPQELVHLLGRGLAGDVHCEVDGSLGPCGVEVISHPKCLACLRSWVGRLADLLRGEARASCQCGTHIHLSVDHLTDRAVRRLRYHGPGNRWYSCDPARVEPVRVGTGLEALRLWTYTSWAREPGEPRDRSGPARLTHAELGLPRDTSGR